MTWKAPRVREPLDEVGLHEYAIGALGRRMRTVAELRRLMAVRVEKGETGTSKINAVVEQLKTQGYLDDRAFAAEYTRLRQEGAKFGRRRVQQDLQRKGVDGELVAATLENAYEQVNEEELARQFIERKRLRKPANEKESARVIRRLVAGGFSLQVAYRLLKQWEVREDLIEVLGQVDEDGAPAGEPE